MFGAVILFCFVSNFEPLEWVAIGERSSCKLRLAPLQTQKVGEPRKSAVDRWKQKPILQTPLSTFEILISFWHSPPSWHQELVNRKRLAKFPSSLFQLSRQLANNLDLFSSRFWSKSRSQTQQESDVRSCSMWRQLIRKSSSSDLQEIVRACRCCLAF